MAAYVFYLLAIAAGVSVAFQQILIANLRMQIGSAWWAAVASYFVGLLFTLIVAMIAPGPKLSSVAFGDGHGLSWLGGIFGAIFLVITILLLPRLGAATTISLVIVGQMILTLAMDHFGLFGLPVQPVSLVKMLGAGLLIAGVVLLRM